MYGSVLPVLAIKYNCISEMVIEGVTGHIFDSESELFRILKVYFWEFLVEKIV
jgi:hypothetical protein